MKIIGKALIPLLLLQSFGIIAQNQMKTVVFVCEHGGARSTVASAYFNKMAEERNLPYRSVSRGLAPDPAISKETEQGLQRDGFTTSQFSPIQLSKKDITPTTILISLDCTVPSEFQTYQAWRGIPAISENYVAAREEIVKHLNSLVEGFKERDPFSKN